MSFLTAFRITVVVGIALSFLSVGHDNRGFHLHLRLTDLANPKVAAAPVAQIEEPETAKPKHECDGVVSFPTLGEEFSCPSVGYFTCPPDATCQIVSWPKDNPSLHWYDTPKGRMPLKPSRSYHLSRYTPPPSGPAP